MAPEQVEGKEADARSDIWALGTVIYEMITGTRPFDGDTAASVIGAILKDDAQPISRIQPLAPLLLDETVTRCLAKDPDDRWQSARDLRAALDWTSKTTQDSESPALFNRPMGGNRCRAARYRWSARLGRRVGSNAGCIPTRTQPGDWRACRWRARAFNPRRWKCHLPERTDGCLGRKSRGRVEAVGSPYRLDHVSGAPRHGRRPVSILVSRRSLARLFCARLFKANRRFWRSVDHADSGFEPAGWQLG